MNACLLPLLLWASAATALLTPGHYPPTAVECVPKAVPLSDTVVTINKGIVNSLKGAIDIAYKGRDIQRFFVLETVARVPYFSYLSCLHLYESLGMRDHVRHMRQHYAEADNELHHLLIMEALGGNDAFVDRFVAQVSAQMPTAHVHMCTCTHAGVERSARARYRPPVSFALPAELLTAGLPCTASGFLLLLVLRWCLPAPSTRRLSSV